MTCYNHLWQGLTSYDKSWTVMTSYNQFWPVITSYDQLWSFLSMSSSDLIWCMMHIFHVYQKKHLCETPCIVYWCRCCVWVRGLYSILYCLYCGGEIQYKQQNNMGRKKHHMLSVNELTPSYLLSVKRKSSFDFKSLSFLNTVSNIPLIDWMYFRTGKLCNYNILQNNGQWHIHYEIVSILCPMGPLEILAPAGGFLASLTIILASLNIFFTKRKGTS